MIATVVANAKDYLETMSTLRWAWRAMQVKTSATVNVDTLGESDIVKLRQQIGELKIRLDARIAEIEMLKSQKTDSSAEEAAVRERLRAIEESNEVEKRRLQSEMHTFVHFHESELADHNASYWGLQAALDGMRLDNWRLRVRIVLNEDDLESMRKNVATLETELRSYTANNSALAERTKLLEAQIDARDKQIRSQAPELAEALAKLGALEKAHTVEHAEHSKDVEEKQALERVVRQQQAELAALGEQLAAMRQLAEERAKDAMTMEAAHPTDAELDAARTQANALRIELAKAKDKSRRQRAAMKAEIARLQAQVETARAAAASAAAAVAASQSSAVADDEERPRKPRARRTATKKPAPDSDSDFESERGREREREREPEVAEAMTKKPAAERRRSRKPSAVIESAEVVEAPAAQRAALFDGMSPIAAVAGAPGAFLSSASAPHVDDDDAESSFLRKRKSTSASMSLSDAKKPSPVAVNEPISHATPLSKRFSPPSLANALRDRPQNQLPQRAPAPAAAAPPAASAAKPSDANNRRRLFNPQQLLPVPTAGSGSPTRSLFAAFTVPKLKMHR